jgi:predicted nucleic acid-binding protein
LAGYFLDSSALAKCYINEVGSHWVRSIVTPASGNDLHVLRIAEVEVTSAIVRRRKAGSLSQTAAKTAVTQLHNDLAREYVLLDVSDRLLTSAVSLVQTHELRAYDAIHLAAAIELNQVRVSLGLPSLIVVSADLELNAATQVEGIQVENPDNHP